MVIKGLDFHRARANVLNPATLVNLLRSERMHDVRASNNNTFTYYSYKSAWHKQYHMKPSHEQLLGISVSALQNFICIPGICERLDTSTEEYNNLHSLCQNKHIYGTHNIDSPVGNDLLQQSIPFLHRVTQVNDYIPEPSSVLWMTSANAVANVHYDLEHNFFWQLYGSKRFELYSVDNVDDFHPYGTAHPQWRQSQQAPSSSKASFNITLNEGDLLYIPPMMFHSVITQSNSISINIWMYSTEMKVTQNLPMIVLPFRAGDPVPFKTSTLARAIIILVARTFDFKTTGATIPNALRNVYSEFFKRWRRRWSGLVEFPEYYCEKSCLNVDDSVSNNADETCTVSRYSHFNRTLFLEIDLPLEVREYSEKVWKILDLIGQERIEGFRKKSSHRRSEIRTKTHIILMNYMEEVMGLAANSDTDGVKVASPCQLDNFVQNIQRALRL